MTAMQEKIKGLVAQNKSLNEIQGQFTAAEAALVQAVYQELSKAKAR